MTTNKAIRREIMLSAWENLGWNDDARKHFEAIMLAVRSESGSDLGLFRSTVYNQIKQADMSPDDANQIIDAMVANP